MFTTGSNRFPVQRSGLHQRIVFGRCVDVCTNTCDGAFVGSQTSHAKVSYLHDFAIGSQQKILRLDIAMNHATCMRMGQSGTNLLEIEKRAVNRQRVAARERRHVAARKVFKHDVMKGRAGEIDGSAMPKTPDDVWVANAIEG